MNKNKISFKNSEVSKLENKIGSHRELDICDYKIKTWREPKYKRERKDGVVCIGEVELEDDESKFRLLKVPPNCVDAVIKG